MRVGLNFTYLYPRRALGHFRVCQGVAYGFSELKRRGELRVDPVLFCSEEMTTDFSCFGIELIPCKSSAVSPVRRIAFENFYLPGLVTRAGIDLLHSFGNSGPVFLPIPTFVTIHDLHHRVYGMNYPLARKLFFRTLAEASLARASCLIAPSQFTARQVKEFLGFESEVVPWSPENSMGLLPPPPSAKPRPFFVAVSSDLPHKQVELLRKAFSLYRERGGNHELVLVGAHGTSVQPGERILPYSSEDELRSLYSEASGFVSASEYEGFGFPMAEALAQGCPVLVMPLASIPEVVGPLGHYFSSREPAVMAKDLGLFSTAPRLPVGSGPLGHRRWVDVALALQGLYLKGGA